MKRTLKLAVVAALAFVLTGCMRMNVDMVLNPDDTISGSMVMAYSDELANALDMSPEELMAGGDMEGPDGAISEPYKQDGFTGLKYTFTGIPLTEGVDDSMSITREGDEFVVAGNLDSSQLGGGMGGMGGTGDPETDKMIEDLKMEVSYSVTFPGPVSSHNGTLDGNTVSWNLLDSSVLTFEARGSAIPGQAAGPAPEPSETPSQDPSQEPGAESSTEGSETPGAEGSETPGAEPSEKPAADPAGKEDKDSNLPLILGIGGGVLLLLLVGAGILIANNNKKKKAQELEAASFAGAPSAFNQGGYQQQGYQQGGYQQGGYQQPGGYDPNAQQGGYQQQGYQQGGYQQPGGYDPNAQQGGYQQQGFQQGGYQQAPVDPNAPQQDIPQPPATDGWYQQGQAPEPTQQFPQPPVDPQNPENPQQ